MQVTYSTNAWGKVLAFWAAPNNVNGAYYMSTGEDKDAISGIAGAGYESVEIFDGNLLAYEGREKELRELLESNKIALKAVYSAANFIYDEILPEEMYRLEKVAAFAKKFGATEIALGGGATRFDGIQESDYVKLAKALDKVCDMAEGLEMTAHYHPHMGSLVESPLQLDKVMANTRIALCPDTGHVKLGGGDPIQVVQKYVERIKYIHLKDLTSQGIFCPLGLGILDLATVVRILKQNDEKVLFAVECDGWDGDPVEGAGITAEYLRDLV